MATGSANEYMLGCKLLIFVASKHKLVPAAVDVVANVV